MKTKVTLGVVIIVMVILIAVSGSAMAARTVPSGNESSRINVETSAHVIGNFHASTDLVLQQSSGDLVPPLEPGEQVGSVGYSETTAAVGGETIYEKDTQINTGGIGDNLQTDRIIVYDGGDTGRMISNEETIVETIASEATSAYGCCPWGSTENATTPAAYEYVQAGSKMDVTEVSAASTSAVKVISDIPGTPVTLEYSIDAHGINQTPGTMDNPAIGSAKAYVDGTIMQGNNGSTQSTNMEYHDVTSVDGLFDLSKEVSYSSAPS